RRELRSPCPRWRWRGCRTRRGRPRGAGATRRRRPLWHRLGAHAPAQASKHLRPDPDTTAGRAVAPPPAPRSADPWHISTNAELRTATGAPSLESRRPSAEAPSPIYHGFLMMERRPVIALLA